MNYIPFAKPFITEDEINEVVDSLRSGWITTGPKVAQFEKQFQEYIGVEHAISVNSATAGLHLALDAIGLKRNDLVIVPTYTFTATAEVVRYFDAHPIFCDSSENTYNINPQEIRKIINNLSSEEKERLKAIIPVHFAGQSCDMDEIVKIAKEFNLKIIEDAAHALPSTFNNSRIGTIGDLTVFSFYATKTIATGEGGMVTTSNPEYAKRIKVMRLHGFNRDAWDRYQTNKASWYYEIVAPGYKYNMTDLAASLGIQQLKKSDYFNDIRNEIAEKYNNSFKDLDLKIPEKIRTNDIHSFHLYVIRVNPNIRNEFIERMKEKNVGCSVHFIPLHYHPYWKNKYNLKQGDYPIAEKIFSECVSLPIFPGMTDEEISHVIKSVREVIQEHKSA